MACFEEALINCYRNYPILYDLSDKNYKNEAMKVNAWKKIAEDLKVMGYNQNVGELKVKVKNLRDVYVRNKKKHEVAIKSGAPATSIPTWEFWPIMTWLDDYRNRRRTATNALSINKMNEAAAKQIETLESGTVGDDHDDELQWEDSPSTSRSSTPASERLSPFQPVTPTTPLLKTNKRKKRKADDQGPNEYQLQLLSCLQAVAQPASQEYQQHLDEYDHFAKSIADQIKRLPSALAKATAKKQIQDVLFNIEVSCCGEA